MNALKILRSAITASVTLSLVSCASMVTQTQFKEYHGAEAFQGKGGTKRTLDGIDIWENGEPNRKFKVLGIIDDDVLENRGAAPRTLNILSVASAASLAGREKRLVGEAKKHGADAIVFVNANRSFLDAGRYETNFGNQVKIVAIKYLDGVGFQLGDSREQIETQLGAGEPVPIEKIGIKLSPDEAADFKCVLYERENGAVAVVVYNNGKADLFMLGAPAGRLNDEAIAGLLRSFAQGQEWKKVPPTNARFPLEWLRSDNLFYAVCLPAEGMFLVGNKRTLPFK